MKVVILTEKNAAALEATVNAWLAEHDVHVRSATYAADARGVGAMILYSNTPEPTDAADRWIGEQLSTRKVS